MSKEILYSEIVCVVQDNLVEAAAQDNSSSLLIELFIISAYSITKARGISNGSCNWI